MYQINHEITKKFWSWLTYGYPKDALVEIILMNIENNEIYNHVKHFSDENPGILMKNNCQFFINKYDDLKKIMDYENNLFCKHSKMCYSIVPRFMKNNDVAGGYGYLKFIDMIFFDIEKKDHSLIDDKIDRPYMLLFVEAVEKKLREYNLTKPLIVSSGKGYHLLYKIRKKEIDNERIDGYREFIKEAEQMSTLIFHIDHAINASRCIAIPESINKKAMKKVTIISEIPEGVNDYYIKKSKKKKKKIKQQTSNWVLPSIKNSLEWKVITHPDVPKGEIHTIVLFSLKLLLKEKNIKPEIISLMEDEINSVRGTNHKLDLERGVEGKSWNPGTMNNWVKRNKEWCQKHGII